jgi:hypothetical protein
LPKNRALAEPLARIAGGGDVADPPSLKRVLAALDRKLLEIARVRREIDALLIASTMVAK